MSKHMNGNFFRASSNDLARSVKRAAFCFLLSLAVPWTVWADTEQQKLTASDGAPGSYFGYSGALDGNVAVIGALGDDDNGFYSGAAYFFYYDGTQWIEKAKLTATDGEPGDRFGCSVALDGTLALIGADTGNDNDTGAAYVLRYDGTQWIQEAKLTASDGAHYDYFGYSVALDGNLALIGAQHYLDHHGSAYVFLLPILATIDIKPGSDPKQHQFRILRDCRCSHLQHPRV